MSIKHLAQVAAIGMTLFCAAAQAAPIMPSFSGAPTGWTTDRYAPHSFSDVGTYMGRSDVLGIGISNADALLNRPAGYRSAFYNTQGKAHAAAGGAGSVLSADLYIPEGWNSAGNGNMRTDMWGVMTDATNVVSDYTIIGFTNYGSGPRLRAWDSDLLSGTGDWVDLAATPMLNSWMSLSIDFTGTSYVYRVNGAVAYTDTTVGTTTQFASVIMQGYNFADGAISGARAVDYTAHWANTPAGAGAVPEPGSVVLLAIGLVGFGAARRRSRKNARG